MTAFLSHQIARLGQMHPLGTVLHLGAGRGTEVKNWLAAGARQIILQDPNPTFHPLLKPLCAEIPRLHLLTSATAAQTGEAKLHQFNSAEHSSLQAPGALQDILPGLRTLRQLRVPTVSLADLLASLSLEDGFCHVLIIDTPGVEQDIIAQLADLPKGKKFERLFLRAPQKPLYQGSADADTLLEMLRKTGYDIAARSADTPDFGLFHLKSRPSAGADPQEQVKILQATLSQMLQECQILRSDLQALRDDHKALLQSKDQMAMRLAELESLLAQANDTEAATSTDQSVSEPPA